MSKRVFFILSFFFTGILTYIIYEHLYIDIFLVLLIDYICDEEDKKVGIIMASLMGFIQDAATGELIGTNMFIKSSLFLIVFSLKDKIFLKSFFPKYICTVIAFALQEELKHLLNLFFDVEKEMTLTFFNVIIFLSVSPFIFLILSFLRKKLQNEV